MQNDMIIYTVFHKNVPRR